MGAFDLMRRSAVTTGCIAASVLLPSCMGMHQHVAVQQLSETFVTETEAATNLDSPTIWNGPGDSVWIIATGKASHKLHVFDAATGAPIRTVGVPGSGAGELRRPNGITVANNMVFVVERDNKRVQVFSLPSFTPIGTFGEDVLEKPYGIAVVEDKTPSSDGGTSYQMYVTDDFTLPREDSARVRAFAKRVKQFSVTIANDRMTASLTRTFGDTTSLGQLRVVESIYADASHNTLLIADEDALDIKVYDLEGKFTGRTIGNGLFRAQPEGIVLWQCGNEGYWIATDQDKRRSRFYVFDRLTFEYLGAFSGSVTANTDGVALTQHPVGQYQDGVFYALQDDAAVSAIAWNEIAAALNLQIRCGAGPHRVNASNEDISATMRGSTTNNVMPQERSLQCGHNPPEDVLQLSVDKLWPSEDAFQLTEGKPRLSEDALQLTKGKPRLSEDALQLTEGKPRLSEDALQLPKGKLQLWERKPNALEHKWHTPKREQTPSQREPNPSEREPTPPALVILLAIDGMRPDYFDRFKSHLTGGLAYIRSASVFYPNGLQDHATTETAPGHATMLSGREPMNTGIVVNDRGVVDSTERTLGNNSPGASPRRFLGTALYDWMRHADTAMRALSISRKDRAAILPIGQARTNVFWFSKGAFTTSTYYARELPAWIREWNAEFNVASFAGAAWNLSMPSAEYPETDSFAFENDGRDYVFPHRFPTDPAHVAETIQDTPFMDSLTLSVALRGIRALRLGQRGTTDLLSLSLSSTDAIGHAFGPDSREIHDQLVKLDRWLGDFFAQLHALVPQDRIILALTADHGMISIPGYLRLQGIDAGEIDVQPLIREVRTTYQDRFQIPTGIEFENGLLFADTSALSVRGVNIDSLATAIAVRMAAIPNVKKVFTPKTLLAASPDDLDAKRWRHSLHPGVQWLVCAVAKEHYVFESDTVRGGTHGTMQPQSLRVPIAFIAPGASPRTVDTTIRTVDIAPTLARLLGVRPLQTLDGIPIALRDTDKYAGP